MAYFSRDDRLVTSLLISSQISDYKVDLPINSSVELIFGNVSFMYVRICFMYVLCIYIATKLRNSC